MEAQGSPATCLLTDSVSLCHPYSVREQTSTRTYKSCLCGEGLEEEEEEEWAGSSWVAPGEGPGHQW